MKEIITTREAPEAVGPYSQAVRSGKTLYLSGQIPLDPETMALVKGSAGEQAVRVLENMGAVLRAAGCGYGDVVKVTIFLTDMGSFSEVNEVYARYFPESWPARSTVQVAALPLGADVEMEAVAVLGEKR